jgi:hydroxypyruvate reductase
VNGPDLLDRMFRAALDAVDGERLVAEFLSRRPPRRARRRGLFACGKAAVAMASGAFGSTRVDAALVVAPRGTAVPEALESATRFASHPEPDASSVAAARAAIAFFRSFGEGDEIVALVSGGASSLLCLPRPGMTLPEKRARIRRAMRAGWPIARLNRLRISLSAVKGGRLADATRARLTTLVLSDVPGDFRLVGSGPTVSARKAGDRAFLLADNRTGLAASASAARATGADVRVQRRPISGEAREVGRRFGRRLRRAAAGRSGALVLIAGGEATVSIAGRAGIGGRNQEIALAAALEIEGRAGLSILAAGSDGVDGSSENAGARVDGRTAGRARRRGLDPGRFLAAHDSAAFFSACGGALRTGPTGTNAADWLFGYAFP